MATYTYTGKTIDHPDDLRLAIEEESVTDATFFYDTDGNISITTTAGTETNCDDAIINAVSGTLFANKKARIRACIEKTEELVEEGVESWDTGKYVKLTAKYANGYHSDYTLYNSDPTKLSVATPCIYDTLDGDTVSTSTLSDIETLAIDAGIRWSTLKDGEVDLIILIEAAANQTALDAIVDTRS